MLLVSYPAWEEYARLAGGGDSCGDVSGGPSRGVWQRLLLQSAHLAICSARNTAASVAGREHTDAGTHTQCDSS